MPHGENAILVLEDGAVDRVIFKDIAEEIAVMDPHAVLPPAVERIRADVPEDKNSSPCSPTSSTASSAS